MSVIKINNIFTDEELKTIHKIIDSFVFPTKDSGEIVSTAENKGTGVDKQLGRIQIGNLMLPEEFNNKLLKLAKDIAEKELAASHIMYAKYSSEYGIPYLPVHYDGDKNVLVIDFQLKSNTSWDLGVDVKNYSLENNSALIFNANEHQHWRPEKTFKDGEYVEMLFVRFFDKEKDNDYSHLDYPINHDIFKEANIFRDTLKS